MVVYSLFLSEDLYDLLSSSSDKNHLNLNWSY